MTVHDLSTGDEVLDEVADIAQRALTYYDVAADSSVSLISISENATFKVEDLHGGPPSILRVHRRGYHSPAAIGSELDWLTALRLDAGIRTAEVRSARTGERIVQVAAGTGLPRECVLFEFLPGAEPPQESLGAKFLELGALTARLHAHARSWDRPMGFSRFHWDYDAALGTIARWGRWQDCAGVGQAERALLQRAQRRVQLRLHRFGKEPDRYGLIHADLRLANLLVGDGIETAIVDFDDCGFGWYLYDLAASLSFFEDDPRVPELIDSWVAGYRTIGTVTAADEAEIATFLLFRRLLLLAWTGSHPAAEVARELAGTFAVGTCELADRYLSSGR